VQANYDLPRGTRGPPTTVFFQVLKIPSSAPAVSPPSWLQPSPKLQSRLCSFPLFLWTLSWQLSGQIRPDPHPSLPSTFWPFFRLRWPHSFFGPPASASLTLLFPGSLVLSARYLFFSIRKSRRPLLFPGHPYPSFYKATWVSSRFPPCLARRSTLTPALPRILFDLDGFVRGPETCVVPRC